MKDTENIREVMALEPDYMGFIFYPESKRYVGRNLSIPDNIPASIRKVGVFVNESTPDILGMCSVHNLNLVQMHGNERPEQCREIRTKGLRVIKVFHVDGFFDLKALEAYKNDVDYFMFDTKTDEYGGSGQSFDWKLLQAYDLGVPFFLSGGLSVKNIGVAVKTMSNCGLHAIDINSKVEKEAGLKDPDLIKEVLNELEKL